MVRIAANPPRPVWVIFDGQSHNEVPASPFSYPDQLMSGMKIPYKEIAMGGKSWTELHAGTNGPASLSARWTPYFKRSGLQHVVAILNGGTQDVLENDTGATIYSQISAYADEIRAIGASYNVDVTVIATTIPNAGVATFSPGFTPSQQTARQTFNSLLLADANNKFDYTVNLDLVLTDVTDPNVYNQLDRVHLTQGGALLVANAVLPSLMSALNPTGEIAINLVADGTDQSASLMAQIDAAPNGTQSEPTILRLPAGTYRMDHGVSLTNRQYVHLVGPENIVAGDPGSFIATTSLNKTQLGYPLSAGPGRHSTWVGNTHRQSFSIISSVGCYIKNVFFSGPNLLDNTQYPGYALYDAANYGDHAFTIRRGCVLCGLDNVGFENTNGDGVYIGDHNNTAANVYITVYKLKGTRAGRQGMALTCVNGVLVEDVDLTFVARTGLDMEPNHAQDRVWNATIRRYSVSSALGSFVTQASDETGNPHGPKLQNITYEDITSLETMTSASEFNALKGMSDGTLTVKRFKSIGSKHDSRRGLSITGPWKHVLIEECEVENSQAINNTAVTVGVLAPSVSDSLIIRNCNFYGNIKGFDSLYDTQGNPPPLIETCGNTWAMGTQNDGECGVVSNNAFPYTFPFNLA